MPRGSKSVPRGSKSMSRDLSVCPGPTFIKPDQLDPWIKDQNKNHSPVNNFAPTVTKFCVMWEGQALPHDTKFRNCRDKIVEGRTVPNWSLIHGSSWSGLIKVGPGDQRVYPENTRVCPGDLRVCPGDLSVSRGSKSVSKGSKSVYRRSKSLHRCFQDI